MSEQNIPKLRFPEFNQKWEKKKLKDVSNFLDGKRRPIKSGDRSKMKGVIPYYGASGIIDYVNDFIFDEELILLGEDGENILSRNLPLAFRVSGKCWINNHAHVLVPTNNTDINFLTHSLENINYTIYNTGTAQPKLNQEVCRNILITFPAYAEQQKIATFLSAVDEKINLLQKKKQGLEHYKKGVMQQLFSQKLRFKKEDGSNYPNWEEKKLDEVLDYEQPTKYLVSSTEYDDSYSTPVLTAGKTFILGFTDETDNIYENRLPVVLFDDFTTATQYVDFPFKAKSSAMKLLLPKDENNLKFIYEAMKHIKFEVGGHGRHWISKYATLRLSFPCTDEQNKIANFMNALDIKIKLVNTQLKKSQQFKKGLLQQMFV